MPAADFGPMVVDIPADVAMLRAIRPEHTDAVPIRDAEQGLSLRVHKADATLGVFQMPVQCFPAIAVDIQVIIPLHRVQPQEIGVLRCIHPESILRNEILGKHTFFMFITVSGKAAAVFENAAIAIIKTQGIDKIVKFVLERLRFQLRAMIPP